VEVIFLRTLGEKGPTINFPLPSLRVSRFLSMSDSGADYSDLSQQNKVDESVNYSESECSASCYDSLSTRQHDRHPYLLRCNQSRYVSSVYEPRSVPTLLRDRARNRSCLKPFPPRC